MIGSNQSLPFLILNLGGEMLYILDQRLQAQSIAPEKGVKVREDVLRHLFAPEFIEELFKPQPLYSMISTRQVFERLAHSSIMKLHSTSMNKLFDLMLMGVKMQIMRTSEPSELLVLTINHLTSLQEMIPESPVQENIQFAINSLRHKYSSMSLTTLYRIKSCLLTFLQDRFTKVSLFLNKSLQLSDGTFKLDNHIGCPRASVPGKVFKLSSKGDVVKESMFGLFLSADFEPYNNQFARLGNNLYNDQAKKKQEEVKLDPIGKFRNVYITKRKEVAKWELNSLSNMINPNQGEQPQEFHFDLFADDGDPIVEEAKVAEVVATSRNERVNKFMQDLETDVQANSGGDEDNELLDLL